jgi:adenosylmethionine-8-amino-7-oxononanoate aminotransferase
LNRQSEDLMHCAFAGMTHAPAVRVAEELVRVAPEGLSRVFYSDNGSTAVEVALKMALQFWQQNGHPERRKFLALPGAFHGDTVGAMSVSGLDEFCGAYESVLFNVERAPNPDDAGGWEQVIDWMQDLMRQPDHGIAAVIVEPMLQGAAGMCLWPAECLARLAEVAREAEVLLIADEIFTGFGRTGEMWACDHAGVSPDILCTAKGLSGGMMPFAATLATEQIYEGFRGGKTRALMHGHTFFGNALGAAIALEVLTIYREERVIETAKVRAATIADKFAELGERYPSSNARSLGVVGAMRLGSEGYFGGLGWQAYEEGLSQGVIMRPLGDTVYLCPPLNCSEDELNWLLEKFEKTVESVLTRA